MTNIRSFVDLVVSTRFTAEVNTRASPSEYSVEEVGDGNLNDVHRVLSKDGEHSVIIKHAPPYIKCLGPAYPLAASRADLEFEALLWFDRLVPGSVPKPYHSDTTHHSFLMEDLRGFEVLKKQLIHGQLDLEAARKTVRYIASIHQQTAEAWLGREEFDKLKLTFENTELKSLTRDFIFTHPFHRDQETNRCSPEVAENLSLIYDNDELLQNANELRTIFIEKKQCLLHGDLHTGSIMAKGPDSKMIDLEFALVGPMGFDIGLLTANYLFSIHAHRVRPGKDPNFHETVRKAAREAISEYFGHAEKNLKEDEMSSLFQETVGFAGCELIRRIVGAAHVEDLDDNPEAEVACLKLGVKLIQNYKQYSFTTITGLIQVFEL